MYRVFTLIDGLIGDSRYFPSSEHTATAYFDSTVQKYRRSDIDTEVSVILSNIETGEILAETTIPLGYGTRDDAGLAPRDSYNYGR